MEVLQEADKLRNEAKSILNKLFLQTMNISSTDNLSISDVDRAVDCIIDVSILEIVNLLKKSGGTANK